MSRKMKSIIVQGQEISLTVGVDDTNASERLQILAQEVKKLNRWIDTIIRYNDRMEEALHFLPVSIFFTDFLSFHFIEYIADITGKHITIILSKNSLIYLINNLFFRHFSLIQDIPNDFTDIFFCQRKKFKIHRIEVNIEG